MPARILIVEDEAVIAMEIESMLEQLGYEVVGHAGRGEEAIELAARTRPDLILMDIRLKSEMDGITAAEKIFRFYRIPVVFLTAHSDRDTLDRAMKIQPFGYLLKPFRKNDLYTSIEIALYKHRALSAEQALQRELFKLHVLDHVTQYDIYNKILALAGYAEILEMELPAGGEAPGHLAKIKGILKNIDARIKFEQDYQKLGSRAGEWFAVAGLVDTARQAVVPPSVRVEDRTGTLSIYADPLFAQVFFHLFENSIKYGRTVSEIRVSFAPAGDTGGNPAHAKSGDAAFDPDGNPALLVIEDNGAGIEADQKAELFSKDLLRSTGKGLFLVQEILQITGMTIRETGEPGKGARFEIAVPRDQYRTTEAG